MLGRITVFAIALLLLTGYVLNVAKGPIEQARSAWESREQQPGVHIDSNFDSTLDAVNAEIARLAGGELPMAEPADDLTGIRRLLLGLQGTIPSLETIRLYEGDDSPDRYEKFLQQLLSSSNTNAYLAERISRAFLGTEEGNPFVFRRDRFQSWFEEQLQKRVPYDQIVREMISSRGIWTDKPATNFVTAAVIDGQVDANELTGKIARACLGQRIDCAECHDHPFAEWKQTQFAGLAAFFSGTRVTGLGIYDGEPLAKSESINGELLPVDPSVPFVEASLPSDGRDRVRLAEWVTSPENLRFGRATANRAWGILFGKPFYSPVDDLPNPGHEETVVLDLLAADFVQHNHDLHRLLLLIASTDAFQRASRLDEEVDEATFAAAESRWNVFPITRLRPEQVIGSMLQAAQLRTTDRDDQLLSRFIRFVREQDFVRDYGDPTDDSPEQAVGTVPQALLRMNGKLTRELTEANFLTASGRIGRFAEDQNQLLEIGFLCTLSRRPTDDEREALQPIIENWKPGMNTKETEDLMWLLFNSTEFSWNH
ncbi:DUF1549 domain-containing protein [Calycomorphotria hydatis]|uniref:Cytochrome c domain-containing protein n=1 Tax=Calycomorphotria hydatis TaxID=2528027 RepID=A0A517TAK2_9PLAN|nr:DUF1549 domain-containing protein [Calycomorphotria hydatis]QDT65397.1 hypothetical protein V22_26500 [Calycomorphotria hydatis]